MGANSFLLRVDPILRKEKLKMDELLPLKMHLFTLKATDPVTILFTETECLIK